MRRRNNPQEKAAGIFHSRIFPLFGRKYDDVMPHVRRIFRSVQKKTKRRPYVRSAYFKKDKIFFDYFWIHLNQKYAHDRARRLRYFPCALELIRESKQAPKTFIKITEPGSIYHQFFGMAGDHSLFSVIVKQERSSGKKFLLSLFPM